MFAASIRGYTQEMGQERNGDVDCGLTALPYAKRKGKVFLSLSILIIAKISHIDYYICCNFCVYCNYYSLDFMYNCTL